MPEQPRYGKHGAVLDREELALLRAAIPKDGSELSKKAIDLLRSKSGLKDEQTDAYIGAAQTLADEIHGKDGEVEVDEEACISPGEEGAYVQAWVFVRQEDIDARIELNAQGTEAEVDASPEAGS